MKRTAEVFRRLAYATICLAAACSRDSLPVHQPVVPCTCVCGQDVASVKLVVPDVTTVDVAAEPTDCASSPSDPIVMVQSGSFAPLVFEGPPVPIMESPCADLADIVGQWYFFNDNNPQQNPGLQPRDHVSIVEFAANPCDRRFLRVTESQTDDAGWTWRWPHLSMLDTVDGHHDLALLFYWQSCNVFLARTGATDIPNLRWIGYFAHDTPDEIQVMGSWMLGGEQSARLVRVKSGP